MFTVSEMAVTGGHPPQDICKSPGNLATPECQQAGSVGRRGLLWAEPQCWGSAHSRMWRDPRALKASPARQSNICKSSSTSLLFICSEPVMVMYFLTLQCRHPSLFLSTQIPLPSCLHIARPSCYLQAMPPGLPLYHSQFCISQPEIWTNYLLTERFTTIPPPYQLKSSIGPIS